jgi:DNA-binding NtrC family response regulator
MLLVSPAAALTELLADYERPPVVVTLQRLTGATVNVVSALKTSEVAVPPLRSRREDIPALVDHFIETLAGGRAFRPTPRLLGDFAKAEWPENVRQLKEMIEEAIAVARSDVLGVDDLPWSLRQAMGRGVLSRIEEAELHELRQALAEAEGNRTQAANILQIGRSTLYRRIESYRRRGFDLGG